MGEGVARDLHTTGGDQFLETIDNLWAILLEKVDGAAGDAEAELELLVVFLDQFQHHLVGGQIAAFSQTLGEIMVLIIIEIVVSFVDVEEPIGAQPEGLANLKVETYLFHIMHIFHKSISVVWPHPPI